MRPILAALITTIVPGLVGQRWIRGPIPLRWGLGTMIGIALLGWGTMLGGLLGSAEAGALSAVAAGWFAGPLMKRRSRHTGSRPPVLALVAVGLVGACLLVLSLSRPVPGYDAWAIWSMKGKAIAASGDFSSPVFTDDVYQYAHRDYPPLLPSWQATAYRISGDPTVGFPTQFQLAWLWTAAGFALVSLAGRRRTVTGLALFAWLVAPQVVGELMSGYADVPMALFLVVGTVALLRADDLGYAPGALLIAAAALTKTEGMIFAIATLIPLLTTQRSRRPAALAGVAIMLAFGPWAAFMLSHGLAGDLTRPPPGGEFVATDRDAVERLPIVLRSFGVESIKPGSWGIFLPACVIALAIARLRPASLVAVFLLCAGALIVIYLITPYDLDWHLSRSAHRVVIAPLGLLALAVEGSHLTPRRAMKVHERGEEDDAEVIAG